MNQYRVKLKSDSSIEDISNEFEARKNWLYLQTKRTAQSTIDYEL